MIYQPLRLGKIQLGYPQTGEETPQKRLTNWMGLLRVSKLINEETRHELYYCNRFELYSNKAITITDWLTKIGAENRCELRSLSLNYRGTDSNFFTGFDRDLRKFISNDLCTMGNLYGVYNQKLAAFFNKVVDHLNSLRGSYGLRFLRVFMWESALRTLVLAKHSTSYRPKIQRYNPLGSFQKLRAAIGELRGVEILHVGLLGGDFNALESMAREMGVLELRITLVDKEATSFRIQRLRELGWIPIATVHDEKLTNMDEAMEEINFANCLPPKKNGVYHFMKFLWDEEDEDS